MSGIPSGLEPATAPAPSSEVRLIPSVNNTGEGSLVSGRSSPVFGLSSLGF